MMPNKVFGNRWKVVRPLVEGGQSWTYVVEDASSVNNLAVLKRLKNKNRLDRFEQELRTVQGLNHPNIVRILDHDVLDSDPYFVMEYCKKGDLENYGVTDWSIKNKLDVFESICSAISTAHANGIVHRDIKPANILIRSLLEPVVSDFGICFVTEKGVDRMTETFQQMGPRFFMAPELADGRAEDVTPVSDVYSLGKLLYWMLAGTIFDREKHEQERWDLRKTMGNCPAILMIYDEVFPRSINENPKSRFPDAGAVIGAVASITERVKNRGRYLDANIPGVCLFCGGGKYQKKQVLPRLRALPVVPGRDFRDYEADYSNNFGLQGPPISNLPQGNVLQGSYTRFLILECDCCGNVQIFRFAEGQQRWKNAMPEIL